MIGIENLMKIAGTSSKKEKEALVKSFKSDVETVEMLKFLTNPYIVTGISRKKIAREVSLAPDKTFNNIIEVMEYLKINNTGTDQVIANILNYINSCDEKYQEFLSEFLTKNLSIGATSKTMNKAIPNLIPEFGVQLAYKFEDAIKQIQDKDIAITLKLDGMRCICINDTTASFFTRSGQEIEDLIELKEEFKKLPKGVYDGELLANGEFESINDRFKETLKRTKRKGDKKGLDLICFDYIKSIEDFKAGYDPTVYSERNENLLNCIMNEKCSRRSQIIKKLPVLYTGKFDMDIITKLSNEFTDAGEEGIMINDFNSPYDCKRTKSLLKVKKFYSVDLKVLDLEEGSGAFKGTLGAFVVSYKDNKVGIGSGLTHEQREEFWANKEEMIGKIIEVNYFEETITDGLPSLRFPTFVCVREDKEEESYN